MKRMILSLLALCLLAGLLTLETPNAHAVDTHSHCVCGGNAANVPDHQCQEVQWTPLSSVVNDLSMVDWKDVPSGYYYLDGNVKVTTTTDSDSIGSSDKNADGTYTVKSRQISLCLNGYNITTTKDRVFKGVYTGSTLNICDCAGEENWGTITGGYSATGGIFYTYANSQVNLYGGNYTAKAGQVATTGGGLFYIAQDRAPVGSTDASKKDPQYASTVNIYDGNYFGGTSAQTGGNIYVAHCSILNVYGGAIYNGTAQDTQKGGGNIYATGKTTVNIQGGEIYGGYPEVAKVITDGTLGAECTLENAVKNYQDGSIIRLYRDLESDLVIPDNILLDLNGHNLSGVSGNFTCMDSVTEQGGTPGVLSCTGTVKVAEGYVALPAENGTSFYCHGIGITHMSIAPAKTAIGYKASIANETVLEQVQEFGLEMWLDGYEHRQFSKSTVDGQLTLRLKNILTTTNTDAENAVNAQTPVYAFPYVILKDGTKLCGDTVSYSFKDMLHAADDCYASFTSTQKSALQTMAGKYSGIMMTWDVENFHHASGWEMVDDTQFKRKLTKSGSNWNITPGTYALTGDVDLTGKTLVVKSGTTVNLCLNGHTISGNQRLLRIYGTLNLCDCHEHGEAEGTMTSSFASTTEKTNYGAIFYTFYGSEFNLYGGNLKATGLLTHAGVGAVSHEKRKEEDYKDIPAGIMNMYGGTISGGNVTDKGGLIWVLHGATFNMYGGELSDGVAGSGGALYVNNDGSSANLLGGKISNCTDSSGYALSLSNGPVTFSGDVQVDSIFLPYNKTLNTQGLTKGAKLNITSDVHGYLADDPTLADCFVLEEGYEAVNVSGKLVAVKTGITDISTDSGFRVGYSSVCINPPQADGYPLSGYGTSSSRLSTEIADDLYVSATAITDEKGNTVLLITNDMQRIQDSITTVMRANISKATGVPVERILLSSSHSHSVPDLNSSNDLIKEYKLLLHDLFVQAAVEAMANRVPATIKAAKTDAVKTESGKFFNFSRHYKYQDANGNWLYWGDNFGTEPPSRKILSHVTEGDHSMQLILFERENQKDVLWCNFGAHPTLTGGKDKTKISSDFVGAMRVAAEKSGEYHFVYIQGVAGNMNPTSRIPSEMDTKAEEIKEHYDKYGQDLAKAALNLLKDAKEVESGDLKFSQTKYEATVWKHSQEEVDRAQEFSDKSKDITSFDDRTALSKEYGFTSVYHANSVLTKAKMGATVDLELNAFSIGNSLAFYTVPGELWSNAGLEVKGNSPFEITFTVGYCNGDWKYFVAGEAADGTYENYEYFYSRFVLPKTTQDMIAWWKKSLSLLHP